MAAALPSSAPGVTGYYYLLGTGSLIDNLANPNGGKTLDPNEKSGGDFVNTAAAWPDTACIEQRAL